MAYGLEISSPALNLSLRLIEINRLRPHEEVIEEVVQRLASEIEKDRMVRDPLIVDQKDMIILDGMHRFNALKRLHCRFAPCCLLDYANPQISVGSWFRWFGLEEPEVTAEKVLSDMRFNYTAKLIDVLKVESATNVIILTQDRNCFSLSGASSEVEHSRIAVDIEKRLVGGGYKVTYFSEEMAFLQLNSNIPGLAIILPHFTKDMIRKFGSEGLLLPHKVTRHVIPSRPLGIDVPLNQLSDKAISTEEANMKLTKLLNARRTDRRPPGSIVEGRKYDEEVILFSG